MTIYILFIAESRSELVYFLPSASLCFSWSFTLSILCSALFICFSYWGAESSQQHDKINFSYSHFIDGEGGCEELTNTAANTQWRWDSYLSWLDDSLSPRLALYEETEYMSGRRWCSEGMFPLSEPHKVQKEEDTIENPKRHLINKSLWNDAQRASQLCQYSTPQGG